MVLRAILCVLALVMVFFPQGNFASALAQTSDWSVPVNLSSKEGQSYWPVIVHDSQENIHVLWTDQIGDTQEPGNAILYSRWDGSNWSEPGDVLLSPGQEKAIIPALAIDAQNNLHVTWDGGLNTIWYSHSLPGEDPSRAPSWAPPQRLSGESNAYFSDIAVDSEGYVHVVWEEAGEFASVTDETERASWEIYYRQSTDGGQTWSSPLNLSQFNGEKTSKRVRMATGRDGKLYVVWADHQNFALGDAEVGDSVYFAYSLDRGRSWAVPTELSAPIPTEVTDVDELPRQIAGLPTVVEDRSGNVHVVYVRADYIGQGAGPRQLLHRVWDGSAWSPAAVIDENVGYAWHDMQLDSHGNIHLVYMKSAGSIYSIYGSTWDGSAWSPPSIIVRSPQEEAAFVGVSPFMFYRPRLTVDGHDTQHLVWIKPTEDGPEIFYTRKEAVSPLSTPTRPVSTPQPATAASGEMFWSPPLNLSRNQADSVFPQISTDRLGRVHLVWGERLNPDSDYTDTLVYALWDGASWSGPNDVLVSIHGDVAHLPVVALGSNGSVHLLWNDYHAIYASYASPEKLPWLATSWSEPVRVGGLQEGDVYWPDLVADPSGILHAVWDEWNFGDPNLDPLNHPATEIYYSRSIDGGQTWSERSNVSQGNGWAMSRRARVAVDSQGIVHVVWTDFPDSSQDIQIEGIYYARSTDGGLSWSLPLRLTQPLEDGQRGYGAGHPAIAVDAHDRVHVVFRALGRGLEHRFWDGQTWSPPGALYGITEVEEGVVGDVADWPDLAADNTGNVHLIFAAENLATKNFDVRYTRWDGNGWSPLSNVTQNGPPAAPGTGNRFRPKIVVDQEGVTHVTWFDLTSSAGGHDIFYSHSTGGAGSVQSTPGPRPTIPAMAETPSIPSVSEVEVTPTAQPTPTATPTSTRIPVSDAPFMAAERNSLDFVLVGALPVLVLLAIVFAVKLGVRRG